MTDQEAFEAWWEGEETRGTHPLVRGLAQASWQAAIAHIKQNYTICEKEPLLNHWGVGKLYREAK